MAVDGHVRHDHSTSGFGHFWEPFFAPCALLVHRNAHIVNVILCDSGKCVSFILNAPGCVSFMYFVHVEIWVSVMPAFPTQSTFPLCLSLSLSLFASLTHSLSLSFSLSFSLSLALSPSHSLTLSSLSFPLPSNFPGTRFVGLLTDWTCRLLSRRGRDRSAGNKNGADQP